MRDFMDKEGPFEGILGFSQGGAFCNSFVDYYLSGKFSLKHPIKFIISICAPVFHKPLKQELLDFQSIHIADLSD